MATLEVIRHRAAICGNVTDTHTGTPLAGVTIEIVGTALKTKTRADGFYYFQDLSNGTYALKADATALGSLYGTKTINNVVVSSDTSGRPIFDAKGNIDLSSPRLSGVVKRSDNQLPIAYADVYLRASNKRTKCSKTGQYVLSEVEAGTQTIVVSATGFDSVSRSISLIAGQDKVEDFSLTPS